MTTATTHDALADKSALQMVTESFFRHSTAVRRSGDRRQRTMESLAVLAHCNSPNLARQARTLLIALLHGDLDRRVA